MQNFGVSAVQFLLLASPVLGINVRLRGQDRLFNMRPLKDDLFNMAWVPEVKPGAMPLQAQTPDYHCTGWAGSGLVCHIEYPEHTMVRRWLPANATVMEFGARFGTTTCEIAKKLGNSGRFVAVEPDANVWTSLAANVQSHQCHARILRGAISSKPLFLPVSGYGGRSNTHGQGVKVPTLTFDAVEQASGLKFDTLVIDCEGCAQAMMDQIGPKIQKQIKLILLEADMPAGIAGSDCHGPDCMDYQKFFSFLQTNGFEQVDEFNDCDFGRTGAAPGDWCGPWINHYAWRKK